MSTGALCGVPPVAVIEAGGPRTSRVNVVVGEPQLVEADTVIVKVPIGPALVTLTTPVLPLMRSVPVNPAEAVAVSG